MKIDLSFITIDANLASWGLLALAFLLAVIYLVWQWSRVARLRKHWQRQERAESSGETAASGVSVVVYAHNDAPYLEKYLPQWLSQKYDGPLEVIVVDDGSFDSSRDVVSNFMAVDPRVRMSFTPHDAHGLSRKKLSLMIGVKAAKHDIIITTNANSEPESENLISSIAANFVPGTDVVIGYSYYDHSEDHGLGKYFRSWDEVRTGTQYLNSALKGKPYRGTSQNLAFRREWFFNRGGYAYCANLKWGEDDVWLKRMCRKGNTRADFSPGTAAVVHHGDVARAFKEQKLRRNFTSRFVRKKQFLVQAVMSAIYVLRLVALVLAVLCSPQNWIVLACVAVLEIATVALCVWAYNAAAKMLRAPSLWLIVPILTLFTPVVNLIYKIRTRRSINTNYAMTIE